MPTGHRTLRLLRPYRSYQAGAVIAATPDLASRLISLGVATVAGWDEFISARPQHERAVATPHVETRGGAR